MVNKKNEFIDFIKEKATWKFYYQNESLELNENKESIDNFHTSC